MSIAIDPQIRGKLEQFASRRRRWAILYAFLVAMTVWLLGALLFTWIDATWILDRTSRSLISLATYVATALSALVVAYRRLNQADPIASAAIEIEKGQPELRDQLLSAVELARDGEASGSPSFIGALQQNVAGKIRGVDVRSLLPLKLLSKPIAIVAGIVLICVLLSAFPQLQFGRRFARAIIPGFDIDRVSRTQIVIERPTPASCSVPANEIAAVVMHLEGELSDKATMQWRSDDGGKGKVSMSPTNSLASDGSSAQYPTFAANLQVNETAVEYRITAGDGVTRWQRLTPHPRPQAVEFVATMTPPAYTKLPEEVTTAAEGHLKGLEGTLVKLRVKFNVPVTDVFMRRINRDERLPMTSVADEWTVDTALDIDDRYQILAKSLETGFDNPLSPQYMITPIDDVAPVVKWKTDNSAPSVSKRRELVTSFSKINLTANFADEMPVESIAQEFSINNGEWERTPLDMTIDTAEFEHQWYWDLQLIRKGERGLEAGDVIQTRVIAIDRKGLRGESTIKEYIVADQQFDSARIARMNSWVALATDLKEWRRTVNKALVEAKVEELKDVGLENTSEDAANTDPNSAINPLAKLDADRAARIELISTMIDKAGHETEAAKLEQIAYGIHRVEESLHSLANVEESKRRDQRFITRNAELVESYGRMEVAHQLGMVLVDNVQRMAASIQPTARKSDPIDWTTFNRYFEVTREQHQEMARLIDSAVDMLPDWSRDHHKNILRWSDDEQRRLTEAISQHDNEGVVRETARHTLEDLSKGRLTNSYQGDVSNRQVEAMKQLQNAWGWTRDTLNKVVSLQDQINQWNEKTKSGNSDEVRQAKENIAKTNREVADITNLINKRMQFVSAVHRRRPEANQRYLADRRLLERVLERLSDDSFVVPEGKTLRELYTEVAAAYHWLESGHETIQWGAELRALADDDRWNANNAMGRYDNPLRIDRFRSGMEYSANGLQNAGSPGPDIGKINEMRWNPLVNQIGEQITQRRWRHETAISAADKLDRHHASFITVTEPILPFMATARKTLESLLPSIPEMARKTAETLRESKQEAKDKPKEQAKDEAAEQKEQETKETEAEKEEAEAKKDDATAADTEKEPKVDEQPADQEASDDSANEEMKAEAEPNADDSKEESESASDPESSQPEPNEATEKPMTAEEQAEAAAEDAAAAKEEAKANAEELRQQAQEQARQLQESLADEANTQELISEEGRRKARNADVSMRAIQERMEDVKEAAEKLEAAQSMDAVQAAAEELDEKTETAAKTLEQIAMHYELEKAAEEAGAEQGMPPQESPLNAIEQELGLTKPLDQQFAKSNALADALNSDPQELLKKLQAELKRNPLMREELEGITDRTMSEAQRALEEQAARERDLQLQLERSDPQLMVAKRELEEAIRRTAELGLEVERSMVSAANQATESLKNLPEESAKKAEQAREELREASQTLNEAVKEASQVSNADNALMSELRERAESVREELAKASQTLKENNQPVSEILQDEAAKLEENRRNEEKRQMESVQRRARDTQVQSANSQARRADERKRQAEREANDANKRLEREQANLEKAQERLSKEPDQQGLQADAARAANELQKAEVAAKAAEAGLEMRNETAEATKKRADEMQNQALPPLDQARPAAQLAQMMQQKASEELAAAEEKLQAAAQAAAEAQALSPNAETLASASEAQNRVANEVAETAEALARSARHKQRLGEVADAQATSEAAAAVKQIAEGAVQQAKESLAEARQAMSPTDSATPPSPQNATAQATEARNELQQSQAALQTQAQQIAQAALAQQGGTPTGEQSPASQSSAESQAGAKQSAQQMARTLDELDRTLSASRRPSQTGDQQSQSPSAQEMATLSAAARKQAQQMAMQRSQMGQPQPPKPGQNDANNPATESGDGDSKAMADLFGLDDVDRENRGEWGKLRSREAEDVAEERKVEISPEYRRQIEAYFRVIAEKGKE